VPDPHPHTFMDQNSQLPYFDIFHGSILAQKFMSTEISSEFSAMSQGYDKEAARKRRGEKRRLKRRSNAIKAANA